jgi:hypothetical protein
MNQWFIVLGTAPDLSKAEIQTVLKRESWGHVQEEQTSEVCAVELTEDSSKSSRSIGWRRKNR